MPETQPSEAAETGAKETEQAPPVVTDKVGDTKPAETQTDPTDLPADHPLVKALAAQKATIKELKTKAARLDDLEEAQKSELQKAIERAEAAEGTLATLQVAQQISDWKSGVAKMKEFEGVPASALRGTSLEEIKEHAAELKALLPEPPKPGQVRSEGRTVTNGTGDPAEHFAELIRNARK
jgi:hypothetical protein